jgi:hypothetical protein
MGAHTLVFIGEPRSGKTVLYVRMREFLSALVSHQSGVSSLPRGLDNPAARALRQWIHGRFASWWMSIGAQPPHAQYTETQGTSERMRRFQELLSEGRWPDGTVAATGPHNREQANLTLVRGGWFADRYTVSFRDFAGETVAMAFPTNLPSAAVPPAIAPDPMQAPKLGHRSTQETEASELQRIMGVGCRVAFVVDGKSLYEGVLPKVTERALAALANSRLAGERRVKLACIITKRDEINLATTERAWSASEMLRSRHSTFWNHLQMLGAPCIDVAAVQTRIGASGDRVPSVASGDFDIGIARIVKWFFTGDAT